MTVSACAEIVAKGDPDRFLATMAAPKAARERLFPLYAFNVEVSRAPWVTTDPVIAEIRLRWWLEVLEEIAVGKRVRSHEVTTPLAQVLTPPAAQALRSVAEARMWDIEGAGFAGADDLWHHLDRTSGVLTEVAAGFFGPTQCAREFGQAIGLASWFRAVPSLAAAKKTPLPGSQIENISEMAKEGLKKVAAVRASWRNIPTEVRPVFLVGWQARHTLRATAHNPSRVIEGRLETSEFQRRSSLLVKSLMGRF